MKHTVSEGGWKCVKTQLSWLFKGLSPCKAAGRTHLLINPFTDTGTLWGSLPLETATVATK